MNTRTRQPTHPGRIIREDYLNPLSITVTELSAVLGMSRKTLSKIINERGSITPDMALRLSRAFNTSADLWMNLQKNHDLWQAERVSGAWQLVRPLFSAAGQVAPGPA
uniref:Addiction module antidote protein, HigA family n=1 Tax=Candidatus Kentrum sp. DK TaxID=2126562 RepID=A0A450S624_9GAMM|nr:MAG: addiction module antidote protein, HigA family [Candidatus Kentron sp. DK]VFJ58642.1 MAG: addiction module antidote protein, HigA family [Candidatus Kentron sp. DK]